MIHSQHSESQCFNSALTALHTAQKEATNEDVIFIGGSNYVVGEILQEYSHNNDDSA